MDATDTACRIARLAPLDLPRATVKEVSDNYEDITLPRKLDKLPYVLAHTFIGCVNNPQVFGTGALIVDGKLVTHCLSSGNYDANVKQQLGSYSDIPTGEYLDGEYVLLWGCKNFGHWIFTYLQRLTLLWHRTDLQRHNLLIWKGTPKRYLEWLQRMGLRYYRFADDGVTVRKLWVPSCVVYRGYGNDMVPFIYPEAVHILRHLILKDLQLPRRPQLKLYISRAKASYRKVVNEEELNAALSERGYQRIFLEELPLDAQLDLMSRASSIVIASGGGSPTTMFAPRYCSIVELTPPNFSGTFASRCWADVLGQSFTRVEGYVTDKTGPLEIDWDYEINVNEVIASL